jgi:beta-xylosidase
MRVFFLDIDGVLNNCTATGAFNEDSTDVVCIAVLNEALRRTGGKIILISTWKDTFQFFLIQTMLKSRGLLEDSLVGMTEKNTPKEEGIQKYLQENKVDDFIIIDDALDLVDENLRSRYFRTNSHTGLEPEELDTIVNFFA